MQKDFDDLGIHKKGNYGLKLDLRLEGFHNFEFTNHLPCIYFRVGENDCDFLPMIIFDSPYIPFSFEQTISNEDLYWVCSWVKTNKDLLLKYANEEIGGKTLFSQLKQPDI